MNTYHFELTEEFFGIKEGTIKATSVSTAINEILSLLYLKKAKGMCPKLKIYGVEDNNEDLYKFNNYRNFLVYP